MRSIIFAITCKRFFVVIFLAVLLVHSIHGQRSTGGWFHIPGFTPEIPITLTSEQTFYGVMGAGAFSYLLSEVIFKNDKNTHYYQVRIGMNDEYIWGLRNVWHQNFGVENRLSPWYAIAAEFNLQEWSDRTPGLEKKKKSGIGTGIMTYYRWYLFGKCRLSPYIEYGTGIFLGFRKFPHNGSEFTFNHSTQLGLEFTLKNKNKIRVGYGQFHQSNNRIFRNNPGYDANGFSLTYSWFWKDSKE